MACTSSWLRPPVFCQNYVFYNRGTFILDPHKRRLLFGISLWKLYHFYFKDYRNDGYITGLKTSLKASLFTPTGWTAWTVTGWAIGYEFYGNMNNCPFGIWMSWPPIGFIGCVIGCVTVCTTGLTAGTIATGDVRFPWPLLF